MQNSSRKEFYEELADIVISNLEKGIVPWQRPWQPDKCGTPMSPFNPVTGTVYKGSNFLRLALDPRTFLTGDPRYLTFNNCRDEGYGVRKGEHGIPLIYYEPRTKEEQDAQGNPTKRFFGLLKGFRVFHASQIEGIPAYDPPPAIAAPLWEKPADVVTILDGSGAVIREVGERAYYSPAMDYIGLPPVGAFDDGPHWGAVALHEVGHWTGAPHRLNRDLSGGFGSALYAKEELRAELSSLFICSALSLPTDTQNHSAYVGHWLTKLREDKHEITKAARDAQIIADYVLDFHPGFKRAHEPQPADIPRPVAAMSQSPAL
jgi:antirestriction protein ArdC